MDAENTAPKQRGIPFEPGKSGNPKGRPKGARNALGENFLQDMLADWRENGAAAIVKMRENDPKDYVKVVASVLPKELNVKVSELDDLTDDQLARQLAAIATQLANAGVDFGQGTGAQTAPEQAGEVSTLQ
ncbi:MAG: DUF5681 domain-containing protein [Pseudomonadota bacterium]